MIDRSLKDLERYYRMGLRSLGITWSRPNQFGAGVPFLFPHSPDTGPGLTTAGKMLVRECNRLGIVIDVSHLNERGFWDVAALSQDPLVATHSNAHAICPSSRNLTDEQLAAIRESGGMVGLNFGVGFLSAQGPAALDVPLAALLDHLNYLISSIGIDHVGFGSDFEGTKIPSEVGNVSSLPKIIAGLRERGYDEEAILKLTQGNWIRVLTQTWHE